MTFYFQCLEDRASHPNFHLFRGFFLNHALSLGSIYERSLDRHSVSKKMALCSVKTRARFTFTLVVRVVSLSFFPWYRTQPVLATGRQVMKFSRPAKESKRRPLICALARWERNWKPFLKPFLKRYFKIFFYSIFSIFVSRMTPELRSLASFRWIVFFLFKSSVLSFSKSLRFFMFQVFEVYEQVWLLFRLIIDHRLLRRIINKRSSTFWDKCLVTTVTEITKRCVLFLVEFDATVRKLEKYDCRFHVVATYFA